MRRLAQLFSSLVTLAALGGCSSSHTAPCDEPITCYEGWSGSRSCCLEDTAREVCGACPSGTFEAAECLAIDPVCEGDDGGPGTCGGPTPLCYQGWSGDAACCLDGGASASCIAGTWICPRGWFTAAACGRIDPVCEGVDAGPGPGLYDDCSVTSDCTLVADSCCGVCGRPELEDVAAVNVDRTGDYYLDVACPEAREEPPICPDCAEAPNPYLIATCDQRGFRPVCAAVDLSAPDFTSCTTVDDCRLAAAECCACGEVGLYETIAVRADASLDALLCDSELPCPPCAPTFDPRATVLCEAGRCVVDVAP